MIEGIQYMQEKNCGHNYHSKSVKIRELLTDLHRFEVQIKLCVIPNLFTSSANKDKMTEALS